MLHIDVNFLDRLAKTCKKFPDRAVDIMQSVKKNQITSKESFFRHIPKHARVCIMGGWYGTPYLLLESECEFTFVDLDQQCAIVGAHLWQGKSARFVVADALEWDYSPYNVIINTSTEHMDRTSLATTLLKLPPGRLCILQNSNQRGVEDHINCFDGEKQFVEWIENIMLVETHGVIQMDNKSERYTAICRTT